MEILPGSGSHDRKPFLQIPFLRRLHWGIVLLCFFFPAVEGCNKKIIIPYLDLLKLDAWLQTSIYLYPILLIVLAWIVFSLINSVWRFRVAWTACYLLFLAVSYLLYTAFMEMPGWYCALLIMIWGCSAFGLLRCRNEYRVMDLTGFMLTALALWLFPFAFLFREKILYGGWLYLYANGFIILTYLSQFLSGLRAIGDSGMKKDNKIGSADF